jgi:hypothetical protein
MKRPVLSILAENFTWSRSLLELLLLGILIS